jgi:hypothetical protein
MEETTGNPALKDLERLVGDWDMELFGASFLPDPEARVRGSAAFKWMLGGALLVMSQGAGTPTATWAIGRDESSEDYVVLYFDNRGVSRVYEMSFSERVWRMWRDNPGFSQRFEGTVSEDGRTIDAAWQKSVDGVEWEHDFNLTYTKAA